MTDQYEAVKLLYRANANDIWLWVENQTIKFKTPKNKDVSEIMALLAKNKADLLKVLSNNKIYNNNEGIKIYHADISTSPLSYSQERLWFIEQYEGGTNAYHIPALFELSGETDAAGIKHALRRIVDRHEVLRSTIGQIDEEGYGVQQVHTHPLEIEEVTLGQGEDHELRIREDINRPFDLSREYPVRVKLYSLAAHSKKLLLVNAHHIASDGWSMDIFQRELLGYYEA
ncbi:condensation domain-containing protein, partial [Mucilaginibacter calamicampi]